MRAIQYLATYKGYRGRVEWDTEARLYHGTVIGISDVVTFEARQLDEARTAFHSSVNDYLAMCAQRGERPERPLPEAVMAGLTGPGVYPAIHEFPDGAPVIGGTIEFRWPMLDGSYPNFKGQVIDIRQFDRMASLVTDPEQPRLAFVAVLARPEMFIVPIPSIGYFERAEMPQRQAGAR